MSNEFFLSRMGQKFYNADVPRLITAVENLAKEYRAEYEYSTIGSDYLYSSFKEGWEYVDQLQDGLIVIKRRKNNANK